MAFSIAIDGPAGAGKSTIAKELAKKIEFIYVDTGAMYRAITLYLMRKNVNLNDETQIAPVLDDINLDIEYVDGAQQVILNGENVTSLIRTQEVGFNTSTASKNKCVREKLLNVQRKLAKTSNVIMDGRDIGTCVLKDAPIKIYLTASSAKRAQRRWLELKNKGEECDINEIEKEIIARDEQDMNREISPLKKADDAVVVDTSDMNINEVVEELFRIYNERS